MALKENQNHVLRHWLADPMNTTIKIFSIDDAAPCQPPSAFLTTGHIDARLTDRKLVHPMMEIDFQTVSDYLGNPDDPKDKKEQKMKWSGSGKAKITRELPSAAAVFVSWRGSHE